MTRKTLKLLPALVPLLLAACGGGGGGGGGDGITPPPPPPPSTFTYSVTLSDVSLVDTRSETGVDATGLPVTGARATRTP